MTYTVAKHPLSYRVWQVEARDDQGNLVIAQFVGREAEQLAREYAEWKNHDHQ